MVNRDFVIQFGRLVAYDGDETYIKIPDNVTTIGRRVFYQKPIEMLVLPPSVTEIEPEAFAFSHIKKLKIEGILTKVGSHAFLCVDAKNDVYGQAPIMAFSKNERFDECCNMLKNIDAIAFDEEVWNKNLSFLGKNLLMTSSSGKERLIDFVLDMELFNELLEGQYIPSNDAEEIIGYLNGIHLEEKAKQLVEYGQHSTSKKRPIKKDNKLKEQFSWKFQGSNALITSCRISEGEVNVVETIGKRQVTRIGSRAFYGKHMMNEIDYSCEIDKPMKRKIIIPNGVNTLDKRSFYVVNNMEIYLPSSLTMIDAGTFVAVMNLVIHIPESVENFVGDILWDSLDETITICAPENSCAHRYAIEHNIKYVKENL